MLKRIVTLNKRDWIGLACWPLISILVGLLALPIMIGREVYQYKHYHLSRFEWEDIVRYSVVIVLGSVANYFIFFGDFFVFLFLNPFAYLCSNF